MTASSTTARIEVFRPGRFTPMSGRPLNFSAADLRASVDAYNPETAPAPVVVGHPTTDAPAFGWAKGFDYDAGTERMGATVGELVPEFAAAVKAGQYRKVSMAFFSPDHAANPVPGVWYPKHIGFLGGAAPAVPGLKNVAFSTETDGVAEFAMPLGGNFDLPTLITAFADLLMGRSADAVPPKIEWQEADNAFSAPAPPPANPTPAPEPKKEPEVSKEAEEAAEAAKKKEADLAAREAALAERENKARHDDNAAFAETIVSQGKLIPASQAALVSILNELDGPDETVAFAAGGDKLTPAAALRKLLSDQPKVVDFSALEPEDAEETAAFASDGKPVNPDSLKLLAKAKAYQRTHPDVDFMSAVKAVS